MPVSDKKTFQKIRNRVRDLYQTSGRAIKAGEFAHMNLRIVTEMSWLIKEVERLAGIEALPPAPPAPETADEAEMDEAEMEAATAPA